MNFLKKYFDRVNQIGLSDTHVLITMKKGNVTYVSIVSTILLNSDRIRKSILRGQVFQIGETHFLRNYHQGARNDTTAMTYKVKVPQVGSINVN